MIRGPELWHAIFLLGAALCMFCACLELFLDALLGVPEVDESPVVELAECPHAEAIKHRRTFGHSGNARDRRKQRRAWARGGAR